MPINFNEILNAGAFVPHGICISWNTFLLSVYVLSDLCIAIAYFSIPIGIIYFIKQRDEISFKPIYYLFAAFIASCGITHLMSIVTLWVPLYYLAGFFKFLTAIISIATAIYFVPKLSEIVSLPDLKEMVHVNQSLKKENYQRKLAEQHLRTSQQRTAHLNMMLQTVLNSIPVRVFWKDTQLNYLGSNMLFAQDAGLTSPEELLGKSDFDLPWADTYANAYRRDDMGVIESKTSKLNFEEPLSLTGGRVKWILTSKVPLVNDQNELMGVMSTYEDITERKQNEQGLLLYTRVFQQAHEGILITDLSTTVIDMNQAFCAINGYQPEELIGKNLSILESEQHSAEFYTEIWHSIKKNNYWQGEIWIARNNGELCPEWVTISSLKDKNNTITGYVGFYTDISEQKKVEQELIKSKESAEQANKAKSEFLANMSHELRTPMHGILSFSKFGIKNGDTASKEKINKYFTNIQVSGERLLSLLNDLLDLSKIEAGKLILNLEKCDLVTIFENCLAEQEQRIHDLGLTVVINKPSIPLIAEFDAVRIGQTITNLLSNAIKFSPEGGIITVTMDNQNKQLSFTIQDQGIGVPEEELKTIFDTFVQSSHTNTGAGGTGLGLGISKAIIKAHKGEIWAKNNPEGGAIFKFILTVFG